MKSILDVYFHVKNMLESAPELEKFAYHGWMHTKNFFDAVCYLAPLEDVDDHDTLILKMAALFHDTGYLNRESDNHEYGSAVIAHNDLQLFGFFECDIDQICKLILSTVPHVIPFGILEEIMRDADLEYLGRDYYSFVAELLREEKNVDYSVWKVEQISFMKKHRFITSSARKIFDRQKAANIRILEEQLVIGRSKAAEALKLTANENG